MRIRPSKRATAAVLSVAVAASVGFAVSAQGAVTDHDVRQSDFTTGTDDGYANSATRVNGHYDFLKEGVRLWTDGSTDTGPRTDGNPGDWNTDKAAEYFAVNKTLSAVTTYDYDWYGTTPSPGIQFVMDFDNDGSQDGILVGEKTYPNQDVWLTGSSKVEYQGAGAPSNTGGSGSGDHGTLTEWSTKYPNAKVLYGGFSLGSGVKGDGVLRSISYGDDRYVFTDLVSTAPPTPPTVNPAGYVFKSTHSRTVLFEMKTASIPAGSKAGNLPTFRVTSSDSTATLQTPAPGTSSWYTNTCPKKVTCTYKAYKNNSLVYTVTIKK